MHTHNNMYVYDIFHFDCIIITIFNFILPNRKVCFTETFTIEQNYKKK